MFDVLVVGAGPVGLYSAKLCESLGLNVAILEEHKEIGRPKHCSGLVSTNINKFFPDIESWGVIENKVNYAVLHANGIKLKLDKRHVAAYVIDRVKFDKKIHAMLTSKVFMKHKVMSIGKKDDCIFVNTNRERLEGKILLACDGSYSTIARILGISPKERIKGLIGITNEQSRENHVDLFFDLSRLKDGFFWRIPRGETTEYGVFGRDVKLNELKGFFKKKPKEIYGGTIPIGLSNKLYLDRILLLGDAAGTVKPWSGGGVIYGLTSARIACKIIKKSFDKNDFSESTLKDYEHLLKVAIGKQINIGLVLRDLMKVMNNGMLSFLFKYSSLLPLSWLDMDFIF